MPNGCCARQAEAEMAELKGLEQGEVHRHPPT